MKNQSTEISDLERIQESKGLKLLTVWSGRLTLWGRLPSFRLSLISLAALRPFNGRREGGGGFLVLQTRGNRSVDRPTPSGYPRYSSRYSGWVFSSIAWERREQESTRHAYASFGSSKSGIFLTERIGPISSSSRRYSKWAMYVRTRDGIWPPSSTRHHQNSVSKIRAANR